MAPLYKCECNLCYYKSEEGFLMVSARTLTRHRDIKKRKDNEYAASLKSQSEMATSQQQEGKLYIFFNKEKIFV